MRIETRISGKTSILNTYYYYIVLEQDKSSDIEQQPPFGEKNMTFDNLDFV